MGHKHEDKYTYIAKYVIFSCQEKRLTYFQKFCSVLVWGLVNLIYWEPVVRYQRLRRLECKMSVHLFHLPRLKFMNFSVQSRISLRDSVLFAANSLD
jgi:hypothetical protein